MLSRQAAQLGLRGHSVRSRIQPAKSRISAEFQPRRWRHYDLHPSERQAWSYYTRRMAVAVGAFGVALYGLNYFAKPYFIVNWPVRVKANAKASLLASKRGDSKEALKYSRQAWLAVQQADVEEFGSDPYLTISGIALMHSQNCLDSGNEEEALKAVTDAFALMMGQKSGALSDSEKVRVIGLLFRAGELSEARGDDRGAQSFFEQSIEFGYRWFRVTRGSNLVTIELPKVPSSLASWMFDSGKKEHLTPDPSEPVVRLARLHSRQGHLQESTELFSKAITMRVDPDLSTDLTKDDHECVTALIMAEYAELLLRMHEEPTKPQAFSKGYQEAEEMLKRSVWTLETWGEAVKVAGKRFIVCEEADAASALAFGALYERIGSYASARPYYKHVLEIPDSKNTAEAKAEARAGLDRLAEVSKSNQNPQ